MSALSADARGARRLRWWVPVLGTALLALVLALIGGRPVEEGATLDPTSTQPLGARALVDVLGELGADVDVTAPPPTDAAVALVLVDRYTQRERDAIAGWVGPGRTLVLLDPSSPLNPVDTAEIIALELVPDVAFAPGCDHPVARGVDRVRAPTWTVLDGSTATLRCFPIEEGYGLVVAPQAGGEIVVVGMPGMATNSALDEADNAVLLANLLAPSPGTRVAVLQPAPPGSGERTLTDLVPGRVRAALLQLLVAAGVLAWWRARRLGAPVAEQLPVEVPGSQLVVAVGQLLQRTGRRDAAAQHLRADLRHHLETALGLPHDAPLDAVAEAAQRRAGVPAEQVRTVLEPRPPASDDELLALARTAQLVRGQLRRRSLAPVSDPAPATGTIPPRPPTPPRTETR